MRHLIMPILCALVLAFACSDVDAYILSFDDVPSGTALRWSSIYRDYYRVGFSEYIQALDHRNSGWGLPRSGSNVMVWTGDPYSALNRLLFGRFGSASGEWYDVNLVGAYFSTEADTVVRVTAYSHNYSTNENTEVQTVLIGSAAQPWDNVYVELGVSGSTFNTIKFEAVSGSSGLRGFCIDDMTVIPVPEPSSLLALLTGLSGLGAALRRRSGRQT